jgi:hypothetical protein
MFPTPALGRTGVLQFPTQWNVAPVALWAVPIMLRVLCVRCGGCLFEMMKVL